MNFPLATSDDTPINSSSCDVPLVMICAALLPSFNPERLIIAGLIKSFFEAPHTLNNIPTTSVSILSCSISFITYLLDVEFNPNPYVWVVLLVTPFPEMTFLASQHHGGEYPCSSGVVSAPC
jgi:hypothetical protein